MCQTYIVASNYTIDGMLECGSTLPVDTTGKAALLSMDFATSGTAVFTLDIPEGTDFTLSLTDAEYVECSGLLFLASFQHRKNTPARCRIFNRRERLRQYFCKASVCSFVNYKQV